jgi:hypothetical protein
MKLRRLKPRVRLLTDFYVADTETGMEVKYCDIATREERTGIQWLLRARPENFVFGVIYGRNYNKVCHTREEFIQTLKEKRFKGRLVFFHNAFYDLTCTYDNIFTLDPTAIFNGSRFIQCTNGVCKFGDSMNIFVGQSVKKIGEQLGIKKPDLGDDSLFSYNMTFATVGGDEINRCSEDCRIVYEALHNSFEFAGDIKITQASLSMTYFRRHHQQFDIDHNENTRFFWSSYYGGRTEAFKIGNTHSVVYDRNSCYPAEMKNLQFPNPKYLKTQDYVSVAYFTEKLLPYYEGCIFATVHHAYNWCGLLPYKRDGKLCFPVGNFEGCWNFNEIRFALQTGLVTIRAIKKVVYAERMSSPFSGYIDKLFDLKNQADASGNEFWRDLYKRYQNSLYGKFAQRIDEESIYIEDITKQAWIIQDYMKKGLYKKLVLFNADRLDCFLIIGKSKKYNLSYSIPSFASYITSGARVSMNMMLLKSEKNRPTYCDTDSVAVENDFGMISETQLGGWKKEGAINDHTKIWTPKIIYRIDGLKNYKFIDPKTSKYEEKLKGVPKKAVKINENTYKYFDLSKTKEGLRRNIDAGILQKRTKEISGKYTKRIVLADGSTQPMTI